MLIKSPLSVALFLLCATAGLNIYALIGSTASDHSSTDFNQLYATGSMLRAGQRAELYDLNVQRRVQYSLFHCGYLPGNHPAYEYLLFAPLSAMSYPTAYFCFLAANLILLGFALWAICDQASLRTLLAMAVIAFSFFPVSVALFQEQDSILLTAIVAAALLALKRNWTVTAGMLAGVGLFKFQLTIPIFLLLLVWKHWRFCLGFLLSGFTLAILSIIVTGPAEQRLYLSMLTHTEGSFNVLIMVNLRALFAAAIPGISGAFLVVANVAIGAVLAFFLSRSRRSDQEALLLAIPLATLCSYHLYSHDLTLLLLPITALLLQAEPSALEIAGATLLLVSPAAISRGYLLVFPVAFFLWVFATRKHCPPFHAPTESAGETNSLRALTADHVHTQTFGW
jgi:Glycosyltransferase family 87